MNGSSMKNMIASTFNSYLQVKYVMGLKSREQTLNESKTVDVLFLLYGPIMNILYKSVSSTGYRCVNRKDEGIK